MKNTAFRQRAYEREEAARLVGIQECSSGPTGVIMTDTRTFLELTPPWFDYTYADPPFNTKKATTEDCYFTRNCSLIGIKQYCNWDAWAGHYKPYCVGKPVAITSDMISDYFVEAVERGHKSGDRLAELGAGQSADELLAKLRKSMNGQAKADPVERLVNQREVVDVESD